MKIQKETVFLVIRILWPDFYPNSEFFEAFQEYLSKSFEPLHYSSHSFINFLENYSPELKEKLGTKCLKINEYGEILFSPDINAKEFETVYKPNFRRNFSFGM